MLPWIHISDLHLFGIPIHPFGLLVATAVMIGAFLAKRRARRKGLHLEKLESFIGWMLLCGFASAHALDEILYRPHEVLARPWSLFELWNGIGSFSGWLGALVGVVMWRRFEWKPVKKIGPFTISKLAAREKKLPILPFADVILSVFPIAWIFGRSGCSIAHDHPGAQASQDAALAIAFPSSNPAALDGPGAHSTVGPITVIQGHYPRYDLGTLELFFTIALAIVFVVLWRRRLVTGAYVVITCLLYAPARFAMDFLRIHGSNGDARYAGLTPAQWLCIALFAFGLGLWRHVLRLRNAGVDPNVPLLAPPSA
jgi:phosphatidylglycerol:prolipoprotein diacylglycerol transferase